MPLATYRPQNDFESAGLLANELKGLFENYFFVFYG
jgi:hypothetical protein